MSRMRGVEGCGTRSTHLGEPGGEIDRPLEIGRVQKRSLFRPALDSLDRNLPASAIANSEFEDSEDECVLLA